MSSDPRVLILTPVKDAARHLDDYFGALGALTYPRHLLSIAFLESDSVDGTAELLARRFDALRASFRRAELWKHDFGYRPARSPWAVQQQPARRIVLAKARNQLLFRALEDEDWVLWLDVDVVEYPPDVIETMLATGKDVVNPNCVLVYGEASFDRNAWRDRGRLHLHDLRGEGDLVPLDSVGGTMLLVRADVHRDGVVFPAFPYGLANPKVREDNRWRGEVETEGFGIMAADAGVQCWGMPNLEILHGERRPPSAAPWAGVPQLPVRRQRRARSAAQPVPPVQPALPVAPARPTPPPAPLSADRYRELLEERVRTLPPQAPAGRFLGRGIVLCAGGDLYYPPAWVCLSLLRRHGCTLPIELWYRGRREMTAQAIDLLARFGVRCVDAYAVAREQRYPRLDSWEIKPLAIAHSRFGEVLYLDADNMPLRNPEHLFDSAPYREHGALFWPDGYREGSGERQWLPPEAWRACGLEPRREPELEAGQLLVDKRRCWPQLLLTLHLNEHSDHYYAFFYGDKDTFHVAWRRLQAPYGLVPHALVRIPGGMLQHDLDGRPLFEHRSLAKWSLSPASRAQPKSRSDRLCRAALDELRRQWRPPMRRLPDELSPAEAAAYAEVATRAFSLAPGGRIELGADFRVGGNGAAANWTVEEDPHGEVVLALRRPHEMLPLRRGEDGVWRGRWRSFERDVAELHPLAS